jgi:hypothetical protein
MVYVVCLHSSNDAEFKAVARSLIILMIRLLSHFGSIFGLILTAASGHGQVGGWGPQYSVSLSRPLAQLYLYGPSNTCYAVQCSTDSSNWTTTAVLNPTVWPAQASITVTQDTAFFRSAVLSTWSTGGFSEALDLRKDFGAIGNGVADDTAAVQAMLNSTQLHSNAVVFVAPGTYQLSQTCALGNEAGGMAPRLVLLGLDATRTIFRWVGPGTNSMFQFTGCSPEFSGIGIAAPNSQVAAIVFSASQ